MTAPPTTAADTLLGHVNAILPVVRSGAERIDADRALAPEVIEALHGAGAFRMAVPAAYGGIDADPVTCARVTEAVASADGSAGWCVMIAWQNAALCGGLPEQGGREILSDAHSVVCGVARQTGKALAVEGGYRISGRWPFASGSLHATWFAAECMVMNGGEPERDAGGGTVGRMCFVPREQVAIHDTWFTTGLRGTGSNDFAVEDVFVPAHRTFRMLADSPVLPHPRYANACLEFISHGAQALGVARGALEAARELAPVRIGYGGRPMAENPRFQADFAEAQALVEMGRGYLHSSAGALWDTIVTGGESTAEARARVRLATSMALRNSLRAVDLLHAGMGTSAAFTSSPLERRFRDIHVAAAHVMIGVYTMVAAGRVLLGREAGFPFF